MESVGNLDAICLTSLVRLLAVDRAPERPRLDTFLRELPHQSPAAHAVGRFVDEDGVEPEGVGRPAGLAKEGDARDRAQAAGVEVSDPPLGGDKLIELLYLRHADRCLKVGEAV